MCCLGAMCGCVDVYLTIGRAVFAKFMVKPDMGGIKRPRADVDAAVIIEAMERFVSNRKPYVIMTITNSDLQQASKILLLKAKLGC